MNEPCSYIEYPRVAGGSVVCWGVEEAPETPLSWYEDSGRTSIHRRTPEALLDVAGELRAHFPDAKVYVASGSLYDEVCLRADIPATDAQIAERIRFREQYAADMAEYRRQRELMLLANLKAKYETTPATEPEHPCPNCKGNGCATCLQPQ